jgi:hypothetical protein
MKNDDRISLDIGKRRKKQVLEEETAMQANKIKRTPMTGMRE